MLPQTTSTLTSVSLAYGSPISTGTGVANATYSGINGTSNMTLHSAAQINSVKFGALAKRSTSPPPNTDTGNNTGSSIGMVLGIIVAIVVAIFAILLLLAWAKKSNQSSFVKSGGRAAYVRRHHGDRQGRVGESHLGRGTMRGGGHQDDAYEMSSIRAPSATYQGGRPRANRGPVFPGPRYGYADNARSAARAAGRHRAQSSDGEYSLFEGQAPPGRTASHGSASIRGSDGPHCR